MSFEIPTSFVQQYTSNVQMLLQQMGSRFRSAVTELTFQGMSAAMFEQFGEVSAVKNLSRHSDTPIISTPSDRRWIYPEDYDWADYVDKEDRLRMLIDPTNPYGQAGAMALARGMDDEIITGIFGSNSTGQSGSIKTGLLGAYNGGSQVVAANVGAASNTGLNVAKLREVTRICAENEIDPDYDTIFMGISAKQHAELLADIQVTSSDYNPDYVLANGRVKSYMGINFINSQRIPGASKFNATNNPDLVVPPGQFFLPFFAKRGVCLGLWNDIQTYVDVLPQKRHTSQVRVVGTFGAARTQEKYCGYVICV